MPGTRLLSVISVARRILLCWLTLSNLVAVANETWTFRPVHLPEPLAVADGIVGRVFRGGPAYTAVFSGQPSPFVASQDTKPKPGDKTRPGEKTRPDSKPKASSKSPPDEKTKSENARLKKVELIRDEERVALRPAELEECVRQLKSRDDVVIVAALEKLALALPDPAYTQRIVRETQAFLPRRDNRFLNRMAILALDNWDKASRITNDLRAAAATGKRVAVDFNKLESEITSGNVSKAFNAMEYLGTTGDPQAAEILVKHFERNQIGCAKALRVIGAPAAPAVVRLFESPQVPIRINAAEILKDIGTANELPALQKATNDSNALVAKKANEAISSINRRK